MLQILKSIFVNQHNIIKMTPEKGKKDRKKKKRKKKDLDKIRAYMSEF